MYGTFAVYDWSEAEILVPSEGRIRFTVSKQNAKLAKFAKLRLVRGGLSKKQATQLADVLNYEIARVSGT